MKLTFELIPEHAFRQKARSLMSSSQWKQLKASVINRAQETCSICGAHTSDLMTHDSWSYEEETHTQKLLEVQAVCKDCHMVIHIGRTQKIGSEAQAMEHFLKVNACSFKEYLKEMIRAKEELEKRNQIPVWELDLKWIKEQGIVLSETKELVKQP